MNTEKILGAGRQEIVTDLIKSCFSEKRVQKLEKTGQKKNTDWKQTQIPGKRRATFWISKCQRRDLFCFIKDSPEEKESHVSTELADKLQRKYITRNVKS